MVLSLIVCDKTTKRVKTIALKNLLLYSMYELRIFTFIIVTHTLVDRINFGRSHMFIHNSLALVMWISLLISLQPVIYAGSWQRTSTKLIAANMASYVFECSSHSSVDSTFGCMLKRMWRAADTLRICPFDYLACLNMKNLQTISNILCQ